MSRTGPRWLESVENVRTAELRLLCLPHAGAGTAMFRRWADWLSPRVQVCCATLPGRERRAREPAVTDARSIADALARAIAGPGAPWVIFGHSMGALIGFELARAMRRLGLEPPRLLIASAARAPHLGEPEPHLHRMPDAELKARLRLLGGTPRELFDDGELLLALLPTIRADAAVTETYAFTEEAPLDCPLVAYAAEADAVVQVGEIEPWRRHAAGDFRLRVFRGGHFYLQHDPHPFFSALVKDLAGAS